jgi:hypothetical protein
MARPAKPAPQNQEHMVDEKEFQSAVEASNTMAMIDHQLTSNAQKIAEQFGYQGPVTVGGVEDEIRFYQRRTAESMLALGTRLIILKELTPHGEFAQRVDLLGISPRAAQKFMQAAFKFSKSANLAHLAEKVNSQSKLLELVMMDDDDLDQLASGETVLGLQLDDIETMTAKELKAALREAKANEEATARIMQQKNSKIDNLETQLQVQDGRVKTLPPDEVKEQLRHEVMTFEFEAEHAIRSKLTPAVEALLAHTQLYGGDETRYIHGMLRQIELACAAIRNEFPEVDHPDQIFDLGDGTIEALTGESGNITAEQLKAN